MRNSDLLEAAMNDDRVSLSIGQWVEIRSRASGELVASGDIVGMVPSVGVIQVADRASGADLQTDIDPTVYDVWVIERDVTGNAPTPSRQGALPIKPSMPGPHSGGRA